jgi:hypothetical protein
MSFADICDEVEWCVRDHPDLVGILIKQDLESLFASAVL